MVGGLSGAAMGAVCSALSGGRAAMGAAVGAAIGVACSTAFAISTESYCHTLADVARDDAQFRADAATEIVDYEAEANVLRSFFIGQRNTQLTAACEAVNALTRLEAAREKFKPWVTAHPAQIGAAIQSVVEELDAPHLRPAGIAKRLEGGVDAACFGLFTLIAHKAFDTE